MKGRGHVILRVQNPFQMEHCVFENVPIKINMQCEWWSQEYHEVAPWSAENFGHL
jgi:hypothetical protein